MLRRAAFGQRTPAGAPHRARAARHGRPGPGSGPGVNLAPSVVLVGGVPALGRGRGRQRKAASAGRRRHPSARGAGLKKAGRRGETREGSGVRGPAGDRGASARTGTGTGHARNCTPGPRPSGRRARRTCASAHPSGGTRGPGPLQTPRGPLRRAGRAGAAATGHGWNPSRGVGVVPSSRPAGGRRRRGRRPGPIVPGIDSDKWTERIPGVGAGPGPGREGLSPGHTRGRHGHRTTRRSPPSAGAAATMGPSSPGGPGRPLAGSPGPGLRKLQAPEGLTGD